MADEVYQPFKDELTLTLNNLCEQEDESLLNSLYENRTTPIAKSNTDIRKLQINIHHKVLCRSPQLNHQKSNSIIYIYIYIIFFLIVDHDQVEIISGGLTFENKQNLPY